MPFLLAEILNFQGSTHRYGVGSFSYFIYSIMELTGSVVRGLKKAFLSMVAMVYPMTWLLAMFSFLLCYRKSELFRSF